MYTSISPSGDTWRKRNDDVLTVAAAQDQQGAPTQWYTEA